MLSDILLWVIAKGDSPNFNLQMTPFRTVNLKDGMVGLAFDVDSDIKSADSCIVKFIEHNKNDLSILTQDVRVSDVHFDIARYIDCKETMQTLRISNTAITLMAKFNIGMRISEYLVAEGGQDYGDVVDGAR